MPEQTPQQQAAIKTHDRNVILVAGAGSGKTYVLVQRYMALLRANPDWQLNALVAITFTRKAANEMRDRVRQTLEREYRTASDERDKARWSDLLADMESARIGTIHSLCASLLRANAALIGLDPDFTVLDETDMGILLENVVSDSLADLTQSEQDAPELEILRHYDTLKIKKVLEDSDLLGTDLGEPPTAEALLAGWQAEWQTAFRHWRVSPAVRDFERWNPPVLSGDKLYLSYQNASESLQKIIDAATPEEITTGLEELTSKSRIAYSVGTKKDWGSDDALNSAREIIRNLRECTQDFYKRFGAYPDDALNRQAAELIPAWVALIQGVQKHFARAKRALNALDFGDLERLTVHLFTDHPHLTARYRQTEFKHVLVDEFQDTNAEQWAIVQALTGLENQGALFVVGDPKQSIYAFRGADVSVFGDTQAQITRTGGAQLDLSQSFRTHAPLVAWFNRLFSRLLIRDEASIAPEYQVGLGVPMDAFRQTAPTEDPTVELILIPKKVNDDTVSTATARQWEAHLIAQRLRDIVTGGRLIYDKHANITRPAQYGDMAVLFSALTDVRIYEDALRAHGVPFITIAGRGYYDRQEVHDVLSLLHALNTPSDNLALAIALHSPLFNLSDEALYVLRQCRDEAGQLCHLWDALHLAEIPLLPADERERVRFAAHTLDSLRDLSGRVTIAELIRAALSRTGYLAAISGLPDGVQRRSNVEKLLNKAQESEKTTLSAFSAYLKDLTGSETREGDAPLEVSDVVQIMTLHKSKGLEFPLVVLADASRKPVGVDRVGFTRGRGFAVTVMKDGKLTDTFSWVKYKQFQDAKDDAEQRRKLYVALTRAQDLLIIGGQYTPADSKSDEKADGFMGLILGALDADDPQVHRWIPDTLPAAISEGQNAPLNAARRLWDTSPVQQSAPLDTGTVAPMRPPLLRPLTFQPLTQARHLATTAIIDIGGVETARNLQEREFYRGRFRRTVFRDAPNVIPQVSQPETTERREVPASVIGEMVHQALQFGQYPTGNTEQDARLRQVLEGYAWEEGVTQRAEVNHAVDKAFDLLTKFIDTPLFRQITTAKNALREIPFIYARDAYIIHGVIDLALEDEAGHWCVVDYKTSAVQGNRKFPDRFADLLRDHARRYHLQVGIYASALQLQLALLKPPAVKIHYVRYGQTVEITPTAWQSAVQRNLQDRIAEMVTGD